MIILPLFGWLAAFQVPSDPIVTDRPDFTESAVVVPVRSIQVEAGVTSSWVDRTKALSLPEVLVRVGVSDQVEARIGLPSWNFLDSATGSASGFDDLYLGAKIQLGPCGAWDLALIPAIYLPVGAVEFRSEKAAPELKVAYATELDGRTSLSAMTSGLWLTESGKRVVDWGQTVSLGIALDPKTAMFLEYAGTFRDKARPTHIAHAGFTFKLSPDRQWDIHFGMSLSGGRRDPFLGFGYAQRF
jgi:hypothetical protein